METEYETTFDMNIEVEPSTFTRSRCLTLNEDINDKSTVIINSIERLRCFTFENDNIADALLTVNPLQIPLAKPVKNINTDVNTKIKTLYPTR